jgi:hypothetical protein
LFILLLTAAVRRRPLAIWEIQLTQIAMPSETRTSRATASPTWGKVAGV